MTSARSIRAICLLLFLAGTSAALSQSIAWYPLTANADDTTGQQHSMTLLNAPFQGGGVYCNGNYANYFVETPPLPRSIFTAFTARIKFKVDEIEMTQPLIICGMDYRWLGIILEKDSTLTMLYNNNYLLRSTTHYSAGIWHEAVANYDSVKTTANLYLDGILACTIQIPLIHSQSDLDRILGTYNPSSGSCFKGYVKDLKIYSSIMEPTSIDDRISASPAIIALRQNYPNPFNPTTTILYETDRPAHVTLEVFDVLGRKIETLVSAMTSVGTHKVIWDARDRPNGIYYYVLEIGEHREVCKAVLLK